ncbi:MAG TPA: ATP-binding protein [Candidatus Acidoferrales bacterium]|jgi:signal transduction histidine kinase|nr:ATP-binding protein [Candidatus Acidoferrales bacterium]
MSSKQKSKIAFALALLLLCVGGAVAGSVIYRLYEAQTMVRHTYEVQVSVADLESSLAEVGRNRVVYVQNPTPSSLKAFTDAVDSIDLALAHVRDLTRDNPTQRGLCNQLEANARERIAPSRQLVELKRQNLVTAEKELQLNSLVAKAAFDTAAITQRMKHNEDVLLANRTHMSNRLYAAILSVLAASFLLSAFMFWLHYYLLHCEFRERTETENQLRKLSMQLMRVQDEERRRFARELHDGVGQMLAAAKMLVIEPLPGQPPSPQTSDLAALLDEAISQTRTISYLFHPPLLDEIGFSSAAKWLIDGFAQRTGLSVSSNIQQPERRLPRGLEITLYRVLQEALNNIHRHSKSSSAEVALLIDSKYVTLRVKDDGRGIPAETLEAFEQNQAQGGVGLLSMKERVREQSGELKIGSHREGTEIIVRIPYSGHADPTNSAAANSA